MAGQKQGARDAAYEILNRVDAAGAYADILLEKGLEGLSDADKNLTTEIVYGVLRFRMRLDWIIDSFSSIKSKKLEHSVLNALRIGAYQLLFLTKIPASAAVNESVNLIKTGGRKKAGFVNAILRKIDAERDSIKYPDIKAEPERHISIVYSHPEWLVKRWVKRYGVDETVSLCEAGLKIPPRTIRVNTLVITRDELKKELTDAGFEVKDTLYSPDGLYVSGGLLKPKDPRYYIQDEASQIIPYLLAPKPGELILDACSAPGGKTTHIAALMRNEGRIYALDKYSARLKSVEETAKRLHIGIIYAMEADSEKPLRFKPHLSEDFDAALSDVPCSGLGVLRRSPDIKYKRKEEDIAALSKTQKRILSNLKGHVKKGGRLVYSTCTFEPEETEDIIREFLADNKDFVLENASDLLPESCKELVNNDGFLRTFPHKHGMDGFFAARLKRI